LRYGLNGSLRATFSSSWGYEARAAASWAKRAHSFDRAGVESMADAVAEKVIATLATVKRIPAKKITLETNLQELGIDSLDVFTLLFELENAFKISIPDDDVRSIRTVNDIVDGVKKLIAAAPPSSSVGSPTPAS
jgi:acyl carrier protein